MRARFLLATGAVCVAGAPVPTPIGFGPRYQLPAASPRVASGAPVGRLVCSREERPRVLAHVELFAQRKALLLPAGIGMAPPIRLEGADVAGARCSYPARTTGPTGIVESLPSARITLGDVFALWGQPLSARRLAGFAGRVQAWVGGCRYHGNVRRIRLRDHAQVVVEIGGYVPPHAAFAFP